MITNEEIKLKYHIETLKYELYIAIFRGHLDSGNKNKPFHFQQDW